MGHAGGAAMGWLPPQTPPCSCSNVRLGNPCRRSALAGPAVTSGGVRGGAPESASSPWERGDTSQGGGPRHPGRFWGPPSIGVTAPPPPRKRYRAPPQSHLSVSGGCFLLPSPRWGGTLASRPSSAPFPLWFRLGWPVGGGNWEVLGGTGMLSRVWRSRMRDLGGGWGWYWEALGGYWEALGVTGTLATAQGS